VKRLFHSAIVWRLAVIAVFFVIADLASAPPVLGSGPTMAVTAFHNGIGAPAGTVSAMNSALYSAVDQTGKFTAVGGNALNPAPAVDGSITGPAIAAAEGAGANEVIVADLISASGGDVVYRLTAYRVAPLAFIRAQVFSQSSLAGASLTANFVSNINTLEAPRTASGLIYSIENGVHADLGSVYGFKLGQQFNVMRAGQKMADAQIDSIDDDSATVTVSNPVGGYTPAVGDQLVGLQPLPALNPPPHAQSNNFTIWGLLLATGGALLAIGHHGQAATVNTGPPSSPTPVGGFSITGASQSGTAPNETFTFTFSQPVNQTLSGFSFATTTYAYYTITSPPVPASPLTNLGPVTFDPTGQTLTVGPTTGSPTTGQQINFFFTSSIQSTLGVALSAANFSFTASYKRHPAVARHIPLPPVIHHSGGGHG
jgi:hypothetical protein